MLTVIILFTIRILYTSCNLNIIDPTFPENSDIDFNITRMLSSASPYETEEVCTPTKAWLLMRHGTKYPSEDVLKDIREKLVPKFQKLILTVYKEKSENFSKLTEDQKHIISKLKSWKNVTASGSHKNLNDDGKLLMTTLGKKWHDKLNKLTKNLKLEEIEVISAKEVRCVVSGRKFLRTFYEGDYDEIDVQKAKDDDKRLKLIKPPKIMVQEQEPLDTTKMIPVEELYFRQHSTPIINRIQELLFPDHIKDYQKYRSEVTEGMVQIMYNTCAHTYYYVNEDGTKTDAWCDLFKFEDLKIFEDMNDLKYYNQNGYHIDDNVKMGNAITKDLLQFIEGSNLKFKLFIGHTSNILSVITRFGLFKDKDKLTIKNIQNMKNRKWRSSSMTPLGCNVMFVVYDCGFKSDDGEDGSKSISFYLNEKPIKMQLMENDRTCIKCPIEHFIQKLNEFKLNEKPYYGEGSEEMRLNDIKAKLEKYESKKNEEETSTDNEAIII